MLGGKRVYYNFEMFHGGVPNNPTYEKQIFYLGKDFKKRKHYLMGKETIIHIDHQPLQYLQAQSKLHQTRHYKWMGFFQQFHLIVKYTKHLTSKLVYMLSTPPTSKITALATLMDMDLITHDAYREAYTERGLQ